MSEAVFGADAGNVLVKATAWLGGIFLVTTLLLARFTATSSSAIDLAEPLENALAEEANKTVELDPSKVDAAAVPEVPAQAQTPATTPEASAQAKTPEAPAQAQTPAQTPAAK